MRCEMTIVTDAKESWYEVKRIIKQKWAQITDDEIGVIDGKREKLISALMAKFSMTETDAEEEVAKFWPKA